MTLIIKLILTILIIECLGILIVYNLLGHRVRVALAEVLGLAFGCGIGVVSFGLFYLAYFHRPLERGTILLALVAFAVGFGLKVLWAPRRFARWLFPDQDQASKGRMSLSEKMLAALMVLICAMTFVDALSQPLTQFDAKAIWGMKARILCAPQGIYAEDFLQPERLHAHQRYPLLVPFAETLVYQLTGVVDDRYVKILFPCFFAALLLVFYSSLDRYASRPVALSGTAMLAVLPAFIIFANGGVASGYADIPLAYFIFCAALFLFRFLIDGKSQCLVPAALFGAFALFTKNEGMALWGICILAGWLLTFSLPKNAWRKRAMLLLVGSMALLPLLPWFHFVAQLPNIDEDYLGRLHWSTLQAGSHHIPLVMKTFIKEFFLKPHLWNISGVLLLAALLLSPRRSWLARHSYFLFIPCLYVALLCIIFLITPWRIEELLPIALTRLWMQVTPIAFFWLLLQLDSGGLLPSFPVDG
jgi:hypothetical protein